MLRVIIISIILAVAMSPCRHVADAFMQAENVRVRIIQNTETLALKINGPYEITDSRGKRVLYRGKDIKTTVTTYKGGILIGDRQFNTYKVSLEADSSNIIMINDRMFRGKIQLIINDDANLTVVNCIGLEDYVRGILYHEVSHYWPMEALKAQAVVSRTYVIYQMRQNKLKSYDVTSDIYSQVYGGMTSERYRTNEAVEATRGGILTYQNKAFPTYYSSTCGGHTEDASLLWNIDITPLKGVPCGFCKDSPQFDWHYVLSLEELEDKLINAGFKIRNIKHIEILGRDKSGRITDLKIASDKKDLKVSSKELRNTIGPDIIRSTNFKVSVVGKDVVFEGFGWGHGVGMCQWGAYFMAKQGSTYSQILKYYYPGSNVKTIQF